MQRALWPLAFKIAQQRRGSWPYELKLVLTKSWPMIGTMREPESIYSPVEMPPRAIRAPNHKLSPSVVGVNRWNMSHVYLSPSRSSGGFDPSFQKVKKVKNRLYIGGFMHRPPNPPVAIIKITPQPILGVDESH